MDLEMKVALGRLLAQGLRIQKRQDRSKFKVSDDVLYGLEHGIESVIDEELFPPGITSEKHSALVRILNEIFSDPNKVAAFKGFYDIQPDVEAAGISRGEAMVLLTYLHSRGQFVEIIKKMDTSHSPSECLDS
jgi:hypothetical protein